MRNCVALLVTVPMLVFGGDSTSESGFEISDDEKGVLEWTNAQRKAAGLPELVANEKLFKAARGHSANMAAKSRLDHNLDGKSVGDRVRAEGYSFRAAGENIAWNSQTPGDTVKMWMNSSGHRANILNANYTEIGIAVAVNARGERYWTQVFGRQ